MPADFVARLGSRATDPTEVRSAWGIEEYAELLAGDVAERLDHLIHREARRLRRLDPDRLRAVLTALAWPPAAELNQARIAVATGIPATTLPAYLDVAVDLGLVRLLPGARAAVAKRAIGRPRVVFDDPAVAGHLADRRVGDLSRVGARGRLAPHLVGVVVAELLRQQHAAGDAYRVAHLRERNGLAVDVVIEMPDNTVYAIEVRTAASLRPHQFRSLEALGARAGWRMRLGIVLNTAPVGHVHRPDLWSLPISSLWEAVQI